MIHDGTYAPADQLPSERDLMRQFGVGRPAMREALFHLRKMGLVEIRSGERARVTRPTPEFVIDALSGAARHMLAAPGGVQDFQNARLFFEVGLARHAALHATEADLADFEAALEDNRAVDRRSQALREDRRRLPLCAGGDPAQPDLHRHPCGARRVAARAAPAQRWRAAQDVEAPTRRTSAIFEAVAARDPDRAERAMREHLDYVARRYTRRRRGATHDRLRRSSSISG